MSLALRHDVSATDTEDGMVLLDEITGRYWQLNGTGAAILRALLGGATARDTARSLGERHPDLPAERTYGDVGALIDSLFAAQLVVAT